MRILPRQRNRSPAAGVSGLGASPLARGLVFAAIPVGGAFYDLVTRQLILTTAGTVEAETPAVPGGTAARAIYGSGSGATAPRTLLDSISGPHSVFVEGSLRVNAAAYWAFQSAESGAGNGFGIKFDDVAIVNNSAIYWSNNSNRTNAGSGALGTDSEKYYHRFSVTNDGTNSRWYTKGGLISTAAMTALPTSNANRRTRILTDYFSSAGSAGVSLILAWDRVLSDAENAAVIRNPWQVFAAQDVAPIVDVTSGGGTTYNVSVAESVTLADADGSTAAFSSAQAEALTLADAPVGAAVLGVGRTESVSLADTAAGAWSTPAALAEAMSLADATDATTGPNVYDVSVTEAFALADSSTGEFPFQAPQFSGADAWPRKRDTLREDVLDAIEALAPSKKIEREAKQAFKRAVDAPQAPSIGPALAQAIAGASERIQALVAQAITQAQAQQRRARRRKQQQQLLLM